jgi:hypothetical protein
LKPLRRPGCGLNPILHPLTGRDGEALAMDVARDGPADADRLLIVSSACHGVEGYCGSGVQVAALHDAQWREKARAQGVAVLYIHALNPYGFSHIRRVTHENVDLNRNFHDFSKPAAGQYRLPRTAAAGQQLGMGAALDDAAGLHHQDFVRIHHGGQAVRDHQRGLALRHARSSAWMARSLACPAPRWPRQKSGPAGSSAGCGQWPRAAFRRPRA